MRSTFLNEKQIRYWFKNNRYRTKYQKGKINRVSDKISELVNIDMNTNIDKKLIEKLSMESGFSEKQVYFCLYRIKKKLKETK